MLQEREGCEQLGRHQARGKRKLHLCTRCVPGSPARCIYCHPFAHPTECQFCAQPIGGQLWSPTDEEMAPSPAPGLTVQDGRQGQPRVAELLGGSPGHIPSLLCPLRSDQQIPLWPRKHKEKSAVKPSLPISFSCLGHWCEAAIMIDGASEKASWQKRPLS